MCTACNKELGPTGTPVLEISTALSEYLDNRLIIDLGNNP